VGMSKKKTHLSLKLGSARQKEIFQKVMLNRYLKETGKDYFISDEEKYDVQEQLDDIWTTQFEDRFSEFASLSPRELEELFDTIEIRYDDEPDDQSGDEELPEELAIAERAATMIIMMIPLRETGLNIKKIKLEQENPFDDMNLLERLKIRWAYDIATRVASYVYEEDRVVRKYLRREIHGLLSAYIPKQNIIPVRDRMIKEYMKGLRYM
jgi:hypothetical protein